ncbi:hypothetical protein FHR75_004007 [Kineococcus radiotolerans]|uniref:Uncharacterized protein n=1 Tax=Kineococcus radiotolerans TaxID=131568 RepID=A0A7W4XZB0_KINRA|nr:hypothetical protein [Kineococcus radiotolerans]MBB2903165.1 hypothetical protein [Kineococcus radiotolerans]
MLPRDLHRALDDAAGIDAVHREREELGARRRGRWRTELARSQVAPLTEDRPYWCTYLRRTVETGCDHAPARLSEHSLISEASAAAVFGKPWRPCT